MVYSRGFSNRCSFFFNTGVFIDITLQISSKLVFAFVRITGSYPLDYLFTPYMYISKVLYILPYDE